MKKRIKILSFFTLGLLFISYIFNACLHPSINLLISGVMATNICMIIVDIMFWLGHRDVKKYKKINDKKYKIIFDNPCDFDNLIHLLLMYFFMLISGFVGLFVFQ